MADATAPAAGPATGAPAPLFSPGGQVNAPGSLAGTSSTPQQQQALLASSAPARTATADNVTKLQTITAPAPSSLQPSIDSINKGIDTYNQTQNPSSPVKPVAPPTSTSPATGAPASNVTPAPTQTASATADPYDAAVKGIGDEGVAAQYKTYLQFQDTEISNAQATIDNIRQRSANDPTITSVLDSIKAKYDQQIQMMRDKNNQLIGRANTSVAAFGGLGSMGQSFLNDQQQRADGRVSDLQNQEDAAIAKAQAAYATQNYKDLNTAMDAYDKANADKLKALNDLLTASSKAVSEQQAQQRLDMQAQKDQLASDVTTSTKVAAGVAANIAAAGLTDKNDIQKYIEQIAAQYGITNPDMLNSAVVMEQQKNAKADLAASNTQSEMDTREKNSELSAQRVALSYQKAAEAKTKEPKPTAAQTKDNFYAGLATLSGTNPATGKPYTDSKGVPYYYTSKQDGASYLTKEGFKTLLAAAKVDGVSRTNFIKDNPDVFDPNGLEGYNLTAKEKTVIAGQ